MLEVKGAVGVHRGESQKAFNTRILCLDSSLRSRMTGKNLLPKKRNSLVPSFLSGGQKRNDDGRKNIIWLLAKNPA